MKLPYEIIKTVAEHEGIPVNVMLKNDRHRRCKDARQKAMYFLKRLTTLTHAEIAHNFEGKGKCKDHSTVTHAIKTVNALMETDIIYRNSMEGLFELFGIKENRIEKQLILLESYNSNAETSMPKLKLQPQKQAKQPLSEQSDRIVSVYYTEALKRTKDSYIKAYGEIKV
jgi:hypothetical protein